MGRETVIRVIVVDDHDGFRQVLKSLLHRLASVAVVGEASNGRDAIELVREQLPDVVIMDVSMADVNGIEATRLIAASDPDVAVLGLSMHSDHRFAKQMLEAGARGYLPKDCAFEELRDALDAIVRGDRYIGRSLRKS